MLNAAVDGCQASVPNRFQHPTDLLEFGEHRCVKEICANGRFTDASIHHYIFSNFWSGLHYTCISNRVFKCFILSYLDLVSISSHLIYDFFSQFSTSTGNLLWNRLQPIYGLRIRVPRPKFCLTKLPCIKVHIIQMYSIGMCCTCNISVRMTTYLVYGIMSD